MIIWSINRMTLCMVKNWRWRNGHFLFAKSQFVSCYNYGWKLLLISHHPVKYSDQRPCGNEYVAFFIFHMTWCVYVIKKLWNLVDNVPPSEATSMSGLLARGIADVKIQRLSFATQSHDVTTQLKDHVALLVVVLHLDSPVCQVWWSLILWM